MRTDKQKLTAQLRDTYWRLAQQICFFRPNRP